VDPIGTQVADTFDPRNLVTQRVIARGTGIRGATREAYIFDGLRRLTFAANYETRSAVEHELTRQTWAYNTLSLPEQHGQRFTEHQGIQLGDVTTGARWDKAGYVAQHIYTDGRVVTHSRDGLNRLRETRDQTGGSALIARYDYAGPGRLIQRTHGNGTVMKVTYESAGCPCGGFSGLVEGVLHEGPGGAPLLGDERRYDVRGDVTAERNGHLGNEGSVYRYDGVQRLVAEARGADLRGAAFATLADPVQPLPATPQTKHWALDTRGNWTQASETDASGTTTVSTAFTPDPQTNVYTSVGGLNFNYDVLDQMTFDAHTKRHLAFDYKGQLVCADDDPDFSTPEDWVTYDTHGRQRIRERWFEGSYNLAGAVIMSFLPDDGSAAGCASPNDNPAEASEFAAVPGPGGSGSGTPDTSGGPVATDQYVRGTTASVPGGGTDGTSPQDATPLPTDGGTAGTGTVATVSSMNGGTAVTTTRHGDAQDTVLGVTAEDGTLLTQYHKIDAWGSMSEVEVSADFGPGAVTAVNPSPFGSAITRFTLAPGLAAPSTLQPGQLVTGIVPTVAGRLSGTLVALGTDGLGHTVLDVRDPFGTLQANALGASLRAFDLFDPVAPVLAFAPVQQGTVGPPQQDPSAQFAIIADPGANFAPHVGNVISVSVPTPGGTYTYYTHIQGLFGGNPTMALVLWEQVYANAAMTTYAVYPTQGNGGATCGYLAGPPVVNGNTTIWHFEAAVPAYVQGWWFEPDVSQYHYTPVGATFASGHQFSGGASKGPPPGQQGASAFAPPVGTSARTGTNRGPGAAAGGSTQITFTNSWHLFNNAGAFAGTAGAGGTGGQGRSRGPSRAGEIHNWHRDYKPDIGRYTTPDPADTPWTNRLEYVGGRPVTVADPTGLQEPTPGQTAAGIVGAARAALKETLGFQGTRAKPNLGKWLGSSQDKTDLRADPTKQVLNSGWNAEEDKIVMGTSDVYPPANPNIPTTQVAGVQVETGGFARLQAILLHEYAERYMGLFCDTGGTGFGANRNQKFAMLVEIAHSGRLGLKGSEMGMGRFKPGAFPWAGSASDPALIAIRDLQAFQGSCEKACNPAATAFDSGYIPVGNKCMLWVKCLCDPGSANKVFCLWNLYVK